MINGNNVLIYKSQKTSVRFSLVGSDECNFGTTAFLFLNSKLRFLTLGVLINKKSTAVDLCLFSLFNEFVPLHVSILLMYDLWC